MFKIVQIEIKLLQNFGQCRGCSKRDESYSQAHEAPVC